jgi:hypothetical protein
VVGSWKAGCDRGRPTSPESTRFAIRPPPTLTDVSLLGRWKGNRLRGRVDREKTAAITMLQTGNVFGARVHSAKAIVAVYELAELEPDDPEHRLQLGSVHYNHAAIAEQGGDLDEAIASARTALEYYQTLSGADITPQDIPGLQLLTIRGMLRPPSWDPAELLAVAGMVADVKARLARLVAKQSGAAARLEVHELGASAVSIYEQLDRFGTGHSADLARVRRQYDEARAYLKRTH